MTEWWVDVVTEDGEEDTYYFDEKPVTEYTENYLIFEGKYDGDYRRLYVFAHKTVTAVLDHNPEPAESESEPQPSRAYWTPAGEVVERSNDG